jgi:hemerythrin-like domain-containing protein
MADKRGAFGMMPAGPLMKEHRLIERMLLLLRKQLETVESRREADSDFLRASVEFMRSYADRCHHGKEEDILFSALAEKPISREHRAMMDSLIEEHRQSRGIVTELDSARQRYEGGMEESLKDIARNLRALLDLYPHHIDTEDHRFFLPAMDYFSIDERDDLLRRFFDFDRALIHEHYRQVVEALEEQREAVYGC